MTEQTIETNEANEANQHNSKSSVVAGTMKAVLSKATAITTKLHSMLFKPFAFSVATGATYGLVSAMKGEMPYSLSAMVIPLVIIGYYLWLVGEVVSLKEPIMDIGEAVGKVKNAGLPDKIKNIEMPEKVNFKWFMKNISTVTEVITTLSTLKDAPKSLMDAAGALKSLAFVLNPMMIGVVFLMTLYSSLVSVMLLIRMLVSL